MTRQRRKGAKQGLEWRSISVNGIADVLSSFCASTCFPGSNRTATVKFLVQV